MKIIYKNNDGSVSIITPSPEALKNYTIHDIAVKDVPAGKQYRIVEDTEIPTDRKYRNAWAIDNNDLTDGVGGDSNEFN